MATDNEEWADCWDGDNGRVVGRVPTDPNDALPEQYFMPRAEPENEMAACCADLDKRLKEDAQAAQGLAANPKAAAFVDFIQFPLQTGLSINMMPFVMGDESSLPEIYRGYWPLITACPLPKEELGKVGYLTITETTGAEAQGGSQRRGGLHTEGYLSTAAKDQDGECGNGELRARPEWNGWGTSWGATGTDKCALSGGIYMASDVPNSTQLWSVECPREAGGASLEGGDCEHLRDALGDGYMPKRPGELLWMTDATPHESVALPKGTPRSYFRLVTSGVDVWWREHSTANPLGTAPPKTVTIHTHSKFGDDGKAPQSSKKKAGASTSIKGPTKKIAKKSA